MAYTCCLPQMVHMGNMKGVKGYKASVVKPCCYKPAMCLVPCRCKESSLTENCNFLVIRVDSCPRLTKVVGVGFFFFLISSWK